jgi:hypothetical protein
MPPGHSKPCRSFRSTRLRPLHRQLSFRSTFLISLETDKGSVMEPKREEDATSKRRGWRFYGTFGCLALLNLICAIDATILAVALPVRHLHSASKKCLLTFVKTIATDLRATAIQAFWCGTSFLLCSTVFRKFSLPRSTVSYFACLASSLLFKCLNPKIYPFRQY